VIHVGPQRRSRSEGHVADDANDFDLCFPDAKRFANRILGRKQLPHELLTDNDAARRLRVVFRTEGASTQQRNADCLEVGALDHPLL
jgi:hypothetical protein